MSPAESVYEALSVFYDLNTEKGIKDMYSAHLEFVTPHYTNFVKLEYFRNCKGPINRFQDIPEQYFITHHTERLFISHKWRTREHPDPKRETLDKLLSLTTNFSDESAIWWDFCCLPQRNPITGYDDRTKEQKNFFKYQLSFIPYIILDTRQMFLWNEEGISSGWCCIENIIANVLLEDLNRTIYERKSTLSIPPLFVRRINNEIFVTSDLYRFDHKIFERIYTTDIAKKKLDEIMIWFNQKINNGIPTTYSKLCSEITIEHIKEMIEYFNLEFTNGSDNEIVSNLLFSILKKLKEKPLDSFEWGTNANFLGMWHYVRGAYGTCMIPKFAYWF